ncbi:MAG TPA: tetratricopeptide repeat protein [Nitrospirota bacterium]
MHIIKKKGYVAKEHSEQEIMTIAHKISDVFAAYRKQIMIGASVVVVLLIILAGFSLMRSSQEKKAAPLVAAAYEYYNPSSGMKPDYAKALELFNDIRNKFSGTRSGAIAHYYLGNCLVSLGRMDEALKEYGDFVKKYSGEKLLAGLVYQRMGYVYEMLGKQADAVKAFEQSESLSGPGVATVELARLYEMSGNMPEAQKKYKAAMGKLGGTAWATEAMGKVQSITPVPQAEPVPGK